MKTREKIILELEENDLETLTFLRRRKTLTKFLDEIVNMYKYIVKVEYEYKHNSKMGVNLIEMWIKDHRLFGNAYRISK